jgi:hypothetical protein
MFVPIFVYEILLIHGGSMREKFTELLSCGCTSEVKAEVERMAAHEGLSMADYTGRAVLRELRSRKQEAPMPHEAGNASCASLKAFAIRFKWPERLQWKGDALYLDGKGHAIVSIVPDKAYPNMWRVRSGERLSDMVNRTRAKDAALSIACQLLGQRSVSDDLETADAA